MVDTPLDRLNPMWAGGVFIGLGIVFTAIHVLHGIEEITETLPAVLFGVVVPLLVSLSILGSGFWVAQREWTDDSHWRPVGWCGGGLAFGTGLVWLLIQYQAAEQIALAHPAFVIAMFGTYGAAVGLLLGWYDVQRQERYAQLQQKTQRLDEFASIVSHDLRNPLNVASGRLDLAHEECDTEHLNHVERALDRMKVLIEDLLTLAREGEAVTDFEPVDLAGIAAGCWATVETTNATLVSDIDRTVQADRQRVRQVFENLFRNAVEHGGEEVTVIVGESSDGFYVEDDGPGIPEEARADVFEVGYSTNEEGTGFGLSIVKQIVEAHDWEIRVTEGSEGGARFHIIGVKFVDE